MYKPRACGRGAPHPDNRRMAALARPGPSRLALYLDLIRWDRPAGWLLLWPGLSAPSA